MYYRMYTLLNN